MGESSVWSGGEGESSRLGAGPAGAGMQALDLIAHLVTAVELTPLVAVRSVDRGGIVRFWNRAAARLVGVPVSEAVGRPLANLLRPLEQAEDYHAALEQVWHTGQPSPPRDWHMRAADGRALWLYTSMFPVYRAGELRQVFCMDVDVTARKVEESTMATVGVNFHQMYQKSSDAVVLIQRDRIIDANPAALALFECARKEQILNRCLLDFSPLQQSDGRLSAAAAPAHADRAYAEGNHRYDWRYLGCEGRLFWAEVLMTSITLDHEYLFYTVIRDISERKAAERQLYLAAQVFENSRDAILLTDARQNVIAINQAYTAVTGYAAEDMIGQPLSVSRSGIEDDTQYQHIWTELAGSDHGHWQGELWATRRGGERYPAWLSLTAIRDKADQLSNYMAILSDITDRKRSEAHTRHLAEHDFLTDLPNRVLLLDRLGLALTAARRNRSMLALLFLDLDRFKDINDTLGHHVGDLLLKEVAARLLKCVRGVDTVSRQGGDEFVIILTDLGGVEQAAHVAASVLQALAQEYLLEQHQLHVSASIGVSIYPDDGADIDGLMRNADLAMYHAKERGRNSFQFFSPEMNARIVERVGFENELRRAIVEQQFVLEYQAEVDIASGLPLAAEALIRWRHPTLGLLPPERFIDVAENSGLMVAIGQWVLQRACRDARRWADAGHPLVVAVNLSHVQFLQKNLAEQVRGALTGAGLAPEMLELELSEAAVMRYGPGAEGALQALRALGVRLAIDDFGTGYTRVGHLRDYPFNKLKIDRTFIGGIHTGSEAGGAAAGTAGSGGAAAGDSAVVAAIIAMARGMGLTVLAEGVETEAQLDFLRRHGCQQYQGRYVRENGQLDGLGGLLDGALEP